MRTFRLLSPLALLLALPAIAAPAPTRVTRWDEFGTVTIEEFVDGRAVIDPATAGAASATSERLSLALGAVTPNPARGGGLVVDIGLPSADPARLELLDVMGRRVASLDLGTLGAGRHRVELGVDRGLAPGLYLLRLTQAGSARVTRVAFVD
jgi:hypothetical protein